MNKENEPLTPAPESQIDVEKEIDKIISLNAIDLFSKDLSVNTSKLTKDLAKFVIGYKASQNLLPVDWDALKSKFIGTFECDIPTAIMSDIIDWFRTNIKTNSPGGYSEEDKIDFSINELNELSKKMCSMDGALAIKRVNELHSLKQTQS